MLLNEEFSNPFANFSYKAIAKMLVNKDNIYLTTKVAFK